MPMMHKIRLRLDALQVESFPTAAAEPGRGAVHAHHASGQSCTYNCTLDELTCNGTACRTVPVVTCLC
jgi:hypothetical protein